MESIWESEREINYETGAWFLSVEMEGDRKGIAWDAVRY
jgi:hypothetical protein